MAENRLSSYDHFMVVIPEPLSEYKRKVLTFLYTPILGVKAANLYTSLFSLVDFGSTESARIVHANLFNLLQINDETKFLTIREKLEALGLLDVYIYNDQSAETNLYLYVVKELMHPKQFISDQVLAELLISKVGVEEFNRIIADLVPNYDINKFELITKSLDDVFGISLNGQVTDYSGWWVDTNNKGIRLSREHFDYNHLQVLVNARDLLAPEVLRSKELYDNVNRLSWLYGISVEEASDAIAFSAMPDKTLDYDALTSAVRSIYDAKNQKIEIKTKVVVQDSNNQLVQFLNVASPLQLVANKTGTKLTSNEIDMFDRLLKSHGVPAGVLNVLILYVLETKNGEIPSYNYYAKILSTWIRAGVKTTEEALTHIQTSRTSTRTKAKTEKRVADWYAGYQKDVNEKIQDTNNTAPESLEELEEFFNNKKK